MYLKFMLLLLGLLWFCIVQAEEVKLSQGELTLNANLEKTDGNWAGGPVVLMTHGTLAHNRMEIISGLQEMLRDRGISSLAINLSLGLDNRESAMYPCETPHRHRHTDAVDEISAWIHWLKGQGVENLSLLGHSRGGNQTAQFAAANTDPAIKAVFLVAPAIWSADKALDGYKKRYGKDLLPILEQARGLVAAGKGEEMMSRVDFIYCKDTSATAEAFVAYYEPDKKMDSPSLMPHIQVPVVVFAGSEDMVVKGLIEKMETIADGDRIQLVVIDGADHFFRDLFSEDISDTIAETLGIE